MTIRNVVLLLTLLLAALTQSPSVLAQTGSKVYRIGTVFLGPPQLGPGWVAFKARLAERGYAEGKNTTFDHRWANDYQGVPELLADLERSGVDAIYVLMRRLRPRVQPSTTGRECDGRHLHEFGIDRQTTRTAKGGCSDGIAHCVSVRARGFPIRPQARERYLFQHRRRDGDARRSCSIQHRCPSLRQQ